MSYKVRLYSLLLLLTVLFTVSSCSDKTKSAPYVKNIERARAVLKQERSEALQELEQHVTPEKIARLVELGLWDKAQNYLSQTDTTTDAVKLVQARLFIKKHGYDKAEAKVEAVLVDEPENVQARLLRAKLYIQSWQLDKADQMAQNVLEEHSKNVEAGRISGKVAMLKRNYDKALQWANKIQSWDSEAAAGFLLEAETLFWSKNAAAAEPALVEALKRNPFSADARFSYGYAIWRRVDATLLDKMAAQWNFALEINPLHYLTHWHFGNGHTNLTYADYAISSDSLVRSRLVKADALVAQGKLDKAIDMTSRIGKKFPKSVLAAMMRGSVYYMYYSMDRAARLDSAAAIFRSILKRKQNYGPAHNGLAAVIKKRQFEYLEGYKKLEQAIKNTPLPENNVFYEVFPDLKYFPGKRVAKMVTQQLGPSRVYLPMINTLGRDFQIMPLHHDLAMAMDTPFFRYGTTFDNRQWMDIRGVGSGATGIEYIERGSHWERNVLAHEYSHLYHGRILTYKESRRIRALYHAAMVNNRTLDYYSANNESEFFAQAYAAYLSDKKVHPLTHKSMNTRTYLREKDPVLYAFIDSLIQKQKAYLAGNTKVMKSNWAQTYVALARNHSKEPQIAIAYLDTALNYNKNYLPALLAYSELESEDGNFDQGRKFISKAKSVNTEYAPVFVTEAFLLHQKAMQDQLSFENALNMQDPLFEKALELEQDLAVRARINQTYRNRSLQYGDVAAAIKIAKRYLEDPPTISTYLRDRNKEARVFVKSLYSSIGYPQKQIPFFKELIQQNPQNFYYRIAYADILIDAEKWDSALKVLKEGQQMLAAAGDQRPGYKLRIAEVLIHQGDSTIVRDQLASVQEKKLSFSQKLYLAKLYVALGKIEKAQSVQPAKTQGQVPLEKAKWAYVEGLINQAQDATDAALQAFRSALKWNAYHLPARLTLIELLKEVGKQKEANKLIDQAKCLAIPLAI